MPQNNIQEKIEEFKKKFDVMDTKWTPEEHIKRFKHQVSFLESTLKEVVQKAKEEERERLLKVLEDMELVYSDQIALHAPIKYVIDEMKSSLLSKQEESKKCCPYGFMCGKCNKPYNYSKVVEKKESTKDTFTLIKEWTEGIIPSFRGGFDAEGNNPMNIDKLEGYEAAREEIKSILKQEEKKI